ncbi:hypothetical protein OIU84_024058 [Salix udensis]|uniref:Uncharacterized protein n=1 Tax=Salix udensis TaxID=889485 RepID=A0AAD6KIL3_9ROSI|nr:hypothetical protein OIU84_024058 [Salix udensis]
MRHMIDTEAGRRSRLHHQQYHHGSTCTRGFRLKYPRKFSVQRFRARFLYLFRFLSRWRSSYGQAVQSLKKGMGRNSSRKRVLVMEAASCHYIGGGGDEHCSFRSFGRSNSFYSEAIADCLEFIKRSSISVEQKQVSPR